MAIPTITKMQQTAQKMLDTYQKQQAASTSATQSGSTSTPTVSSTPKVTQTQKAQSSVTQPTVTSQIVSNPTQPINLTKINLFKPQETVKTLQSANLLTQNNKVDSPTITSELAKMYDILPDNMKGPVDDAIENNAKKILYSLGVNTLRSTKAGEAANMFSNKLLIGGARETIDIGQGYINKIYNSGLLPGKRNFMMNMMLPGYGLYRDYLNNKLENTQIGQQTKQVRDTALKAVFDWTERGDQKLANLEGYKYATKKQEEWSDKGKGIRDAIDEGRWDIVATNVGETAGQMLPSLIMAFVTKDPKIAAGGIFTTVFGSSYKRSLLEVNNNPEFANLTPDQKDNLATSMAVVEAGIETLGDVIELAPFMKGKSFSIGSMLGIKNALLRAVVERQGASIIEGGEEVLTEILQNAFKRAYGGSDRATAEELGQIFSDTYFIMQFLGLLGGTKGGIETHRRNTAEKLLAHEAEKFDNFEEFEAAAQRGGVEDEELIQDAWARAKGLTAEQSAILKRDTKDVQKQEQKAKDLYEERAIVESTLNTLRQSPLKDQSQITKLEVRLQEIDNKLQEIDNKIQEYNDLYGQGNVEVVQAPYVKQEGGKNLSQQTMQTITEPLPTIMQAKTETQESLEKKVSGRKNMSYYDIDYIVDKINKLTNRFGKKRSKKFAKELALRYDDKTLATFENALGYDWLLKPELKEEYRVLFDNLEDARIEGQHMEEKLNEMKLEGRKFKEGYQEYTKTIKGLGKTTDALNNFVIDELDTGLHLLGLKGVDLKSTEGKVTEDVAKRFSMLISRVSQILGIDFNKVVRDIMFSVTETEGRLFEDVTGNYNWEGTMGFLSQIYPQEVIEKFYKKEGLDLSKASDVIKAEIGLLKAGIALAIDGTEMKAIHIIAHEFMHLLDLKRALGLGGELKRDNGVVVWDSAIDGEVRRNTFQMKDNLSQDFINYLNRPVEILARYAEQYVAFKTNKTEYRQLTNRNGYRKHEEFKKLMNSFKSVIEDEFSDFALDAGNIMWSDVMGKLNEFKQGKITTDAQWLEDIKDRENIGDEEMANEIANKILQMEKQYMWVTQQIDKLEGEIGEEVRIGYEMTLQDIENNYNMLVKLKDKYIEATKNTKAQQENLNEMTNTISDNIENAETSATDIEQGSEIISDTVTEPDSENNPTGIDTTAPLHEQITQSVDITLKSVDKLVKNKKNKAIIHEVGQGFKNAFTPALSRLYSISPRLAGGVHRYQAMKELLTNSYKKATLDFVKAMDKLKKKNPEAYKKLSLALFDYGMVDTIDIKEELKKAGIDTKLFEPVAQVLNQIAKDYQAAGLDITVNDRYFPRKVKDYGLLLDYLSMKSGKNIEDTRTTLLKFIEDTNNDPTLSEGEKEKKIHSRLINEFSKPSEMSNNAKERKLVLSEWQLTEEEKAKGYKNDITDFYEEPIVALSMYIEDMVKKTELKKMLGGLTEQGTAISEDFDTSIAGVLMEMQAKGELTKEQADEAAYVIKSIVNVKPSGKLVQAIKDATYNLTIANYLSAAQQLEDLSKTLLRGPSGFKNIVKSILGKAGIKMKDTGLNNLFDTVQKGGLTDWNFKLSGFDMVDSLGKVSFLNTAYDSCVKQANGRRAIILQHRLTAMYGEVKGMEMFEKYKEGKLKTDEGLLDLDLMVDLLYQLGSTQPIYQSAMPTAYLNNPGVRLMYCLYSFSIKQVDWVIQGTKEVYQNQLLMGNNKAGAATVAGLRCIRSLTVVALFSALVGDLISTAKGDEEDTVRWNWINNGWKEGLKRLGINGFTGFLKIFNISRYDSYIFKREGLLGVLMSKLTPASVSIANDLINIAVGKEELSDLGRYGPLFLKPMYYIFKNNDMMPDYKLWEGGAGGSKSSKFGKTSVGTSGPVNTSKFGGYSVK